MIDVTCAVIRNEEEEILVVQRGEDTDHPFKWEFPGGKVMAGESEDESIIREIKEELSMDVVIYGRIPVVEYDYGHKQIRLIPFICDTLDDLPFLSEHLAFKWMKPEELISVDFSEADVFVAESYLGTLNWVAASAVDNPAIFLKLLEYSYSNDKKLAFHASWIMTKVCDKFPSVIDPFLPQIVDTLKKLENESTLRSFLRIISRIDLGNLDQYLHGLLADQCFYLLNSGISAIAVKAYSMEILYRLSMIYPSLATELAASIGNLMGEGSAGITSRGRTILKKLNK